MGREIQYCSECRGQLREAAFEQGRAFRVSHRACCADCAPELVRRLPADEMRELLRQMNAAPKTPRATPRPFRPAPAAARPRSALPWIVGGVACALGVGVVVAILVRPTPSATPSAVVERPPAPPSPPPKPPSEDGAALVKEMAALDVEARLHLEKEEFGEAIRVYQAARTRRAEAEWAALLDGKIEAARKDAARRLEPLLAEAVGAKRRGEGDRVVQARARVAGWKLPEPLAAFDAALNAVPEPDLRPWEPVFDGRTTSFLNMYDRTLFVVENGLLRQAPGKKGSGQSLRTFSNGELRVRFDLVKSGSILGFYVRQGPKGSRALILNRQELDALSPGVHELIFVCAGEDVRATLDGRPVPLESHGKPGPMGHLQFNSDAGFRIHSVDVRPPR